MVFLRKSGPMEDEEDKPIFGPHYSFYDEVEETFFSICQKKQ